MFSRHVRVGETTFSRKDVERILRREPTRTRSGAARNLYILSPAGAKVGVKAVVRQVGAGDHHPHEAAHALLQLGFVIHAKRRFPTHDQDQRFAPYRLTGRFVYDTPETLHRGTTRGTAKRGRNRPTGDEELTSEQRQAIEGRAEEVCREFFRGWQVHDVSEPEGARRHLGADYPGYDMLVKRRTKELHVEIKGTRSSWPRVTITENELKNALQDPKARLLVVSGIRFDSQDGRWQATGGLPVIYRWGRTEEMAQVLAVLAEAEKHLGVAPNKGEWQLEVPMTPLLSVDLEAYPRS